MTYFLNFRSQPVGGSVLGQPYLLTGDGETDPPSLSAVSWQQVNSVVAGRNLVFVTHGFNVPYQSGANALDQFARYLNLPASHQFIGMLWSGDAVIPYIDYPFEGGPAMDSGAKLAAFCNRWCAGAQSLSFVSHSLGARMVLQGIAGLTRRARLLCMMAGAINRDCLSAEYTIAAAKCDRIAVLASHSDDVLKLAFPVGDLIADLLHSDHLPRSALGYNGPPSPTTVIAPWQIADACDYGHGDYLPSAGGTKWQKPADFVSHNVFGQPVVWPA